MKRLGESARWTDLTIRHVVKDNSMGARIINMNSTLLIVNNYFNETYLACPSILFIFFDVPFCYLINAQITVLLLEGWCNFCGYCESGTITIQEGDISAI